MIDVVALARLQRDTMQAELDTLDRFIGAAKALLSAGAIPIGDLLAREPGQARPADSIPAGRLPMERPLARRRRRQASGPPPDQRNTSQGPESSFAEWGSDTFHFEEKTTETR